MQQDKDIMNDLANMCITMNNKNGKFLNSITHVVK